MQALAIFPNIVDDDMAIPESRIKGIDTQIATIRDRLGKIEGRLDVPAKSPHGVLIVFLSIVGAAMVGYWGWIGVEVVNHGKMLSRIVQQLDPTKPLQDISQLEKSNFANALPRLQNITSHPAVPYQVPQPVLHEVSQKLLAADEASSEYWPTVLQFIQFASAGLSPDVPPAGPPQITIAFNRGISFPAISHRIVLLDGGELVNTRFDHCRIIFTDHPVKMSNVLFVDSVFELPVSDTPNPYIQDIGRTLLASDLKSVTLPKL